MERNAARLSSEVPSKAIAQQLPEPDPKTARRTPGHTSRAYRSGFWPG
jgi:hypothetical protein